MARHKFNARKCSEDGYVFDSLGERERYRELKLMVRAGEITGLRVHPEFLLLKAFRDRTGKWHRKIVYIADFAYIDSQGFQVVEDFKSSATKKLAVFNVKWKLAIAQNPTAMFRIVEA